MIKVSVDESYAYDMLSILKVKTIKATGTEAHSQAYENYSRLGSEIARQLKDHDLVLESEEYFSLCGINDALFDKIDDIKAKGEKFGDGQIVDELNYKRYLLKKQIQGKFFAANPLTEQKIGYKNE